MRIQPGQQQALKWLAIVTMTLDHVGRFVGHPEFILLGRWALPLFAFLVAYNLRFHTRNGARYLRRLVLWGIVSEPIYRAVFPGTGANVLFTLACGVVLCLCLQRLQTRWFIVPLAAIAGAFVSYGPLGVSLVLLIYASLDRPLLWGAVLVNLALVNTSGNFVMMAAAVSVIAPFVLSSQCKLIRGYKLPSWAFYVFYPGHLWLIYAIF